MLRVYGVSDDLVEIENTAYKDDEIGCFEKDVRIRFKDGTVIRVGYPKKLLSETIGVWWIEVEKRGYADQSLTLCFDEDADIYSDVFEIESEVKSHTVVEQKYKNL